MTLKDILNDADLILTECAITERIRRKTDIELHPTLFNAPLIFDKIGASYLEEIYGQYLKIARNANLPILLCAPTWRVDKQRIVEANFDIQLNRKAVAFMREIQNEKEDTSSPFFIGGLVGPKNDCYNPSLALSQAEAEEFHSWQVSELAQAGVDFIIAQTMPALSEVAGLASALSKTGLPYIISFVINKEANLLDGTPLDQAIKHIDKLVFPRPDGYMVNCAYPTFIRAETQRKDLFKRLIGIMANSSSKDHDQLDGANGLEQDDLNDWGDKMLHLNKEYGMKILGGCCGTDDTYLQYLVDHY